MRGQLKNIFKTMTVSIPTFQISAGGYKQISLSYTVPSGYKAIGCVSWHLSGSPYANMFVCTTTVVIVGNTDSNIASINGNVVLLLVKET